jgi:hypothetical protein
MDESRMRWLEEKLERIAESQSEIKADLQEHMRRTLIAESNIEKLAASMAPVQEHVAFIKGFGRFLALIATVGGTVAALMQTFRN